MTKPRGATQNPRNNDSSRDDSNNEGSHGTNGAQPLAAALYVVATPIGNLGDISARALAVLRDADVVACEDTRVTAKLLTAHGVRAKTLAYNDHNAERVRPQLIKRLQSGASVALVSDAGTPVVSDPGYKLVRDCHDAGIAVAPVPGASAVMAAVAAAGVAPDRFLFAGFLPTKAAARRRDLASLAAVPASLVFFESARRLGGSLADMVTVLGGAREAAVVRELTKLHEEVRRGTLAALAEHYATAAARGEIVVVVGPPGAAAAVDDDAVDAALREAMADMRLRDAVDAVSAATGRARRDVYARALALRDDGDG